MDMDGSNDSKNFGDQRLPSFQGPRDLKLLTPARPAATGRRTFQPNIRNVTRDRNAKATTDREKPGTSSASSGQQGPSRGGRHNAREFKKREPPQLVQASSIFAEGVGSASLTSKSRSGGVSSGGGGYGSKGYGGGGGGGGKRRDEKADRKDIKSYNEGRGFITDLPQKGEEEYLAPMTIPLSAHIQEYEAKEPKIKMEVDAPPVTAASDFADLVRKAGEDGTVILVQLPEHFPLLLDENEDTKGGQVLVSGIQDFPPGMLGSTEILSSGLSKLTIGENTFSLEPGTQPSFYQELVYVTDESVISLGPVRRKFLCTSDVDSFLTQS